MHNIKGLNVWRRVQERLENLQRIWITACAVSLSVLLVIPKADRRDFCAIRRRQRDQVQKPFLLAQPWKNFALYKSCKFRK